MKVTFNNGYYIVKTATRETQYLAEGLDQQRGNWEVRIALMQRGLKDLEAIAQYRKEQS